MKSSFKLFVALHCFVLTVFLWAAVIVWAFELPYETMQHAFLKSGILLFVSANLAGLILLLAYNGDVADVTHHLMWAVLWTNPFIAILVWLAGQARTALWLAWQVLTSDSRP